MRKSIVAMLSVLLIILAGCQTAPSQQVSAPEPESSAPAETPVSTPVVTYEYLKYEDDDLKIKYPANWTKKEGVSGTRVVFQSDSGIFSVGVKELEDSNTTLDDFSAWNVDQKRQTVDGFAVVGFDNTTLSGLPARSLVFTGTAESGGKEILVKRVQMWTLDGGKAYLLEYVISITKDGEEKKFDLFKLRKIASTFTIKDADAEAAAEVPFSA